MKKWAIKKAGLSKSMDSKWGLMPLCKSEELDTPYLLMVPTKRIHWSVRRHCLPLQ